MINVNPIMDMCFKWHYGTGLMMIVAIAVMIDYEAASVKMITVTMIKCRQ